MQNDQDLTLEEAMVLRMQNLIEQQKEAGEIESISELAQNAGIKQSTLNEILHGRSKHPTFMTITNLIGKGFGMTMDEFMADAVFNRVANLPESLRPKKIGNETNLYVTKDMNINNVKSIKRVQSTS